MCFLVGGWWDEPQEAKLCEPNGQRHEEITRVSGRWMAFPRPLLTESGCRSDCLSVLSVEHSGIHWASFDLFALTACFSQPAHGINQLWPQSRLEVFSFETGLGTDQSHESGQAGRDSWSSKDPCDSLRVTRGWFSGWCPQMKFASSAACRTPWDVGSWRRKKQEEAEDEKPKEKLSKRLALKPLMAARNPWGHFSSHQVGGVRFK